MATASDVQREDGGRWSAGVDRGDRCSPLVYVDDATVIAVPDSPKPPPTRISLTFRALDAANEVWFIASGASKAAAVALALSGAAPALVPAAGPHGRQRTLWLLDRDAAAELPEQT